MPFSPNSPAPCHWFSALASFSTPAPPRGSSVSSSAPSSPPADAPSPLAPRRRHHRRLPPRLHHRRRRRQTHRPPGRPTRPLGPPADAGPDRPPDLGHRRHAHPTLRAGGRGRRRPPQPDAGAGRRPLRLRTRLGRPRLAGPPPRLGHDRPAAAGPPLRPQRRTCPASPPDHRPAFRTKLELAVELVRWAVLWLGFLGKALWVVADGAYAKARLPQAADALGVTVVSRLARTRRCTPVPAPRRPGQRGRPPLRRTTHRPGQTRRSKTRLALRRVRPVRQADAEDLQDVLGDVAAGRRPHPRRAGQGADGWVAFFCTDPAASVADVLGSVADRFSLETAFRETKEVVGAGQQQVRFLWANVGAFHICLWTYTRTEAWAWGRRRGAWWTARRRHGTTPAAGPRTPTSVGPGGGTCWARKSGRFSGRRRPTRKSRPSVERLIRWAA